MLKKSFEDVGSKINPLLVMLYEFERGNGVIEVSSIGEPPQQSLKKENVDDLDFLDHDL